MLTLMLLSGDHRWQQAAEVDVRSSQGRVQGHSDPLQLTTERRRAESQVERRSQQVRA